MIINAEVKKHEQETGPSVIRRFTKRVQESGSLSRARTLRARTRLKSRAVRRKQTLKRLTRRDEITRLVKMGKLPEKQPVHRRRF